MRQTRTRGSTTIWVTVTMVALIVGACSSSTPSSSGKTVLKVAYGSQYVFVAPQLATEWWGTVAREFEATHPNVTVQFVPIPGAASDVNTKMSLLFRSPSTSPDVAEFFVGEVGLYASSDFLLPLNKYVSSASWWNQFPRSVQSEGNIGGTIYSVNHGEDTNGLWYNVPMFKKAGIAVPWQPKTWNDILAAAAKIKSALPKVTPLFLAGGSAGGTISFQYNGGNLLAGTSVPTIYDKTTKKWVVDSPGLRATLQFYKDLASNGYQAPVSDLLNPDVVNNMPQTMSKNNTAIAVGANFWGGSWTKADCAPCWAQAPKTMSVAYLPTENGQSPGYATALGGMNLAIGAKTQHAQLAWDFINTAQQETNMINASNWIGLIPPSNTVDQAPGYTNFAPPYQALFAKILPIAQEEPVTSGYTTWVTGFNDATGAIIQNPNTTVSQAINIMKTFVTGQLGSNMVETLQ